MIHITIINCAYKIYTCNSFIIQNVYTTFPLSVQKFLPLLKDGAVRSTMRVLMSERGP